MTALKNRRTAALAMCAMMLLGLFLGTYLSGRRLYSRVEDVFYNGEKGNGVGVASDLTNRANCALNLVTVAKRYMQPDGSLVTQAESASAKAASALSLNDKKSADTALSSAVAALYDGLGQLELSQKDQQYRSSIYADFKSYGSTMSHDPYNEEAVQYNLDISGFPSGLLMGLMGFEPAPVFR